MIAFLNRMQQAKRGLLGGRGVGVAVVFGIAVDELVLGTVVDDAVSIVAAYTAASDKVILAAIGLGVDHHHGVSHHAFLENVASLIRAGGFLGTISLDPESTAARAFLDLVD